MSSPAKKATKWGEADRAKFRLLVNNKKIKWNQNDTAYLRQVRDKHWPGRRTPTFKNNWKNATAEFRTSALLNGARERLEGVAQEEEDSIDADTEELEDEEDVMPPSAKKKPAKKTAPTVSEVDDDLAKTVGQVTIRDKPYSFDRVDPWFTKQYCKKNINYAEVDFFVGGVQPEGFFQVDLVEDGNSLRYQKATPDMFGETSRLKKAQKSKWHSDDTRVVAHDNTVQMVRKNDKPKQKMNWGKCDAEVVPLPFRCRGKIKKSWDYYNTSFKIKGHQQYIAILTCRVEAAEQRNEREKKGKVSIHDDDLSQSSEESDSDSESDGGNGGYDERENGRVPMGDDDSGLHDM